MDLPYTDIAIIGAGLAGWSVVDAIRAQNKDVTITLITADNADRYHKPMLTMAISQNKAAKDLVRASGIEAAKTADVTLLSNTYVTSIDTQEKQITVAPDFIFSDDTGENADSDTIKSLKTKTISFNKLVLAMGAHPIFPPNLPENLVWHVNHIDKFNKLQKALAKGSQKVAIIGAGMVGTEIAEDLLKAGHSVTLLDINDAPLAQMLPKKVATRIKDAVQTQGINFLGGQMVTAVKKLANAQLELTYAPVGNSNKQKSIVVDHVLASAGLRVDANLPESGGINFDKRTGIAVDETTLQTSQPDVYAIGDCMSINGVPCRYVAPLRAQAATIADQVVSAFENNDCDTAKSDSDNNGLKINKPYVHKPPMIRLKNKAISVMVTGVPTAKGNWQVVNETNDELVMNLMDDNGGIVANVNVKSPVN